jgi:hypothetical protein
MKYDRYEIKKVEHLKSMSEETECFSLDLYVDGKKFAHVANRGHGGCHETHPYPPFTYKDIQSVTEDMKKDKFLVDSDFEEFDTGVSTMLSLWMSAKEITRGCKTKALFLVDNEMRNIGYKDKKLAPDQRLFNGVKEKYPDAVILNGMDIAEAAKLVVLADRAQFDATYGDSLKGLKA